MPTYDSDKGIRWIDPLNSHELDVKVEQARLYSEMPSHTHTFTGTAVSHNHGICNCLYVEKSGLNYIYKNYIIQKFKKIRRQ